MKQILQDQFGHPEAPPDPLGHVAHRDWVCESKAKAKPTTVSSTPQKIRNKRDSAALSWIGSESVNKLFSGSCAVSCHLLVCSGGMYYHTDQNLNQTDPKSCGTALTLCKQSRGNIESKECGGQVKPKGNVS